jgi:hypothetical protein
VLHSAALTPGAALLATLPVMASVSRANGVMTLPFANNLGGRWLKVKCPGSSAHGPRGGGGKPVRGAPRAAERPAVRAARAGGAAVALTA